MTAVGVGSAGAYPMPPAPTPKASSTPSPAPTGSMLPFDSTVLFVLDDPISSQHAKAGQIIRAHLKSALYVAGRVVAPAGAPAHIRIVDAMPSDIADAYGFVDIFFEPLTLSDGRALPLRAPVARLAPRTTSGHESTVAAEDTVGDIFVPYYMFYQIFRKGKNFTLGAGSELPARTEASITALRNGTFAIVTPPPLPQSTTVPNATFPVLPEATPIGGLPTPVSHSHPTATPATSSPTPSPSPSP